VSERMTIGAVLAFQTKPAGKTPVYWRSPVPDTCQLSDRKITTKFVDGRVPGRSSWACMHPDYYLSGGGTFGTGRGQLYQKQADGRWLKING